jgi:hypothetical protein
MPYVGSTVDERDVGLALFPSFLDACGGHFNGLPDRIAMKVYGHVVWLVHIQVSYSC